MMSYTRLYVEPIEALLSQARKKRFLSLLKQRRENRRVYNSFLIIIRSKHRRELPVLHYHEMMGIYPYPFWW